MRKIRRLSASTEWADDGMSGMLLTCNAMERRPTGVHRREQGAPPLPQPGMAVPIAVVGLGSMTVHFIPVRL